MGWDRLFRNLHLATLAEEEGWGIIHDAAVAVQDGRIAWIGREAALPRAHSARHVVDLEGAWVTPGLIDCHTHLVFGGSRVEEFEKRLEGVSYAEIARSGGGIMATVRATRAAGEEELLATAHDRLLALLRGGVTTVEIKSGYGLDVETECRMLRVARRLGEVERVDVRTTFLGLHALPPEFCHDRAAFVREVSGVMLERVVSEGLADMADAFLESIAFDRDEVARFLSAAREKGLALRLHADQLEDGGGAALAAELGALSADHLEYASPEGVRAMAAAGTVAVLLPGAYYSLRERRRPPVERFRDRGVPMAVATDANPGSSPLLSPLLALNMACILFGLRPVEAVRGMTLHAARALGLAADRGSVEPGKRADLAVWRIEHPAELCYWMGDDPLELRVLAGEPVAPPARRLMVPRGAPLRGVTRPAERHRGRPKRLRAPG